MSRDQPYTNKYIGNMIGDSWMVEDKLTSLQNRTHISRDDALKATKFIQDKYSLSQIDALKKLVNCAIDKKIKIKVDTLKSRWNNEMKVYSIINLDEL